MADFLQSNETRSAVLERADLVADGAADDYDFKSCPLLQTALTADTRHTVLPAFLCADGKTQRFYKRINGKFIPQPNFYYEPVR